MPNESSGKDLRIIPWSLLRQVTLSWRNLRHKVSIRVKVFPLYSFFFHAFFLSPDQLFGQRLGHGNRKTDNKILINLHTCTYG